MKKIIVFLIVWAFVVPCNGVVQVAGASGDGLDYLRNEIQKLEHELSSKIDKLNKCAEKNKNFKIAGIVTVGLAGAGVATNIALYAKMKDQKKMVENMKNKINTADIEMNNLINEFEALSQNVDKEKFARELDSMLTETEKQRLVEFYNNDFDTEKIYNGNADNIPESDKVLMGKIVRAMRNSQK